jgi:hypothetical protein
MVCPDLAQYSDLPDIVSVYDFDNAPRLREKSQHPDLLGSVRGPMRHQRHITAFTFLAIFAAGQAVARPQPDDSQIRQQIIQESVDAYLATGHPCACGGEPKLTPLQRELAARRGRFLHHAAVLDFINRGRRAQEAVDRILADERAKRPHLLAFAREHLTDAEIADLISDGTPRPKGRA